MANHKSALKRARQNEIKRIRNKSYKTRAKKAIKEVRNAVADDSADLAKVSLSKAVSMIQKNVSKGVIHNKQYRADIHYRWALFCFAGQEFEQAIADEPPCYSVGYAH